MRKTKIYLDTSVISFLYADDAPELRAITEDFFQNYVRTGLYEVYISEVVLAEIERTVDPLRRAELLAAIEAYPMRKLEIKEEIGPLALEYITTGVIPPTRMDDARHVAVATYHEMDILLSWNFKHLANIKKQTGVKAVNERNGYFHPLLLTNPMEVLYEHN
jgi:predicted nucleic acid-binding protein